MSPCSCTGTTTTASPSTRSSTTTSSTSRAGSGTAACPPCASPAPATTRTGWTVRASGRTAFASTRPRFSSTPTRGRSSSRRSSTARPPGVPGRMPDGRRWASWGPIPANGAAHEKQPRHTWDTVIYEMHVKGFTCRPNSGVRVDRRGTFAGVVDKIPYLKELGVTVVELLPVYQRDPQEDNYWGYMPLNFFAPHGQYAAAGTPEEAIEEMAQMVRALHEAGIEVILDVVYNHTVEGDEVGPTYCYRGIDNSTYYLLQQEDRSQLPQRRRHRQRPPHRQPGGSQDGRGQHAVLGARDARGRVPLRPGFDLHAPDRRVHRPRRPADHLGHQRRPRLRQRAADRRGVGSPQLPARAEVSRPWSGSSGTTVSATRCGPSCGATRASWGT